MYDYKKIAARLDKKTLAARKDPTNNGDLTGYDEAGEFSIPVLSGTENEDKAVGLMGYGMVAPAEKKVTLLIQTEKRGSSYVTVDAPPVKSSDSSIVPGDFFAGKSYTLVLEFKSKGIEVDGVTIQDWELDEIIEEDI